MRLLFWHATFWLTVLAGYRQDSGGDVQAQRESLFFLLRLLTGTDDPLSLQPPVEESFKYNGVHLA